MASRNSWRLKQLYLQMPCKGRNFEAIFRRFASTSSQVYENCKTSLLDKLNAEIPEESDNVCIYRVPAKLCQVEEKAYELKLKFFHRVFRSKQEREVELERVISTMEELEPKARNCYADDVKLSRDEFIEMMTMDGCFILQLLTEVGGHRSSSSLIQRWMLQTLHHDSIKAQKPAPDDLALKFVKPLLKRDLNMNAAGATTMIVGNITRKRQDLAN